MSEVVQCLNRPRFVQCHTFYYCNLLVSDLEDFVLETVEYSAALGFTGGSEDVVTSLPAGRRNLYLFIDGDKTAVQSIQIGCGTY